MSMVKVLRAHVVASTSKPGTLSLRLSPGDATWSPFIAALRDAGFEPGDEIAISLSSQLDPRTIEACAQVCEDTTHDEAGWFADMIRGLKGSAR